MAEGDNQSISPPSFDWATAQRISGKEASAGPSAALVPTAMTVTIHDPATPQHLLTDEQLNAFHELSSHSSFDWFLGLAASALGFVQNFLYAGEKFLAGEPIEMLDGCLSIVFIACVAGAIAKWFEYKRIKPKLDEKIEQIRSRPKITIRND